MPKGIGALVRGFWQAAKKLGRASLIIPNDIRWKQQKGNNPQSLQTNASLQEKTARLEERSAKLHEEMGDEAYYRLAPVFTEMPFIRPMGHNTQLPTTIRYIDMNPQRLATKHLKPGFFRVLRDYMNDCVLMARKGVVMVSPFISPKEKEVMQVLLKEQHPFILLVDNGFRDYYKPADAIFDACAAGRLLILSPWPYDEGKRHISRAECVALNTMAEEICIY